MKILSLIFDGAPAGEITLRPTIPLDRALLCGDCGAIFEAEGEQQCPACGSKEALSLGRALNRDRGGVD